MTWRLFRFPAVETNVQSNASKNPYSFAPRIRTQTQRMPQSSDGVMGESSGKEIYKPSMISKLISRNFSISSHAEQPLRIPSQNASANRHDAANEESETQANGWPMRMQSEKEQVSRPTQLLIFSQLDVQTDKS